MCDVYLPAYRQALESPYPAALDDVEKVYNEIQPDYIIGDSAGGGLALALLLRLRERIRKKKLDRHFRRQSSRSDDSSDDTTSSSSEDESSAAPPRSRAGALLTNRQLAEDQRGIFGGRTDGEERTPRGE